jgi:hypothetical protein
MLTNWPALGDLNIVYTLVKEWCDRHYPLITYKVLNIDETKVDSVHEELPDYNKTWTDKTLRAFAAPTEQGFPLTVFGIEELRDVVLHVSVPHLIAAGLATQDAVSKEVTLLAKTGDRFLYTRNVLYTILTWKIGGTFANTDVPVFYVAAAEKVHLDAYEYQACEGSCETGCEALCETGIDISDP